MTNNDETIEHKVTRKVRKKQQTNAHFPIFDSKPIAHFPIFDNKPNWYLDFVPLHVLNTTFCFYGAFVQAFTAFYVDFLQYIR